MENDGPPSLERVQRWKLAKANWDQFQHLCSTRLQQSAIADADDPMSFFTSILKDIAEETIPKTSAVPKRFNKPWFSDICKDAIKERNRALERFKREPTEGNLNVHLIMLKYTTSPYLWKSCGMLCVEPMIPQQDQMKYSTIY